MIPEILASRNLSMYAENLSMYIRVSERWKWGVPAIDFWRKRTLQAR